MTAGGGVSDTGSDSDVSGNTGSDSGSSDAPGPSVPVEENFDFAAALGDRDNWEGVSSVNPVFYGEGENQFLTFRPRSNNSVGYTAKGMSTGDLEMKLRVSVNSDTTACVMFSNQSEDLSAFCYEDGGHTYTLEFSNDGKMYVKKWTDGKETRLGGAKASVNTPLSYSMNFTALRISVSEADNAVGIKVYQGNTLLLDVADSDHPLLGGGGIGLSYQGAGGMVAAGKDSANSAYQEPEELGLTIYESPDVEQAHGEIDLLENFESNWKGRENLFNVEQNNGGWQISSKYNYEEPQAGVTEYQAVYATKIFGNVELEYTFNMVSNNEWTMFWLRCVPEKSDNVSIWGNKKTGESTNGYSVLITRDGYLQVHKWSEGGAQTWLNGQGTKLPNAVISAMGNPTAQITLKAGIEERTLAGEKMIEFRFTVNGGSEIVVQDTDTPFLNAGYIGMQGYATKNGVQSIRLLSAKATTIEE